MNDTIPKFAYVTMVINNDLYASSSILLAESIRNIGGIHDLVILVDDKITKETIDLLKKFYDEIITVKNIEINNIDMIQKIILTKLHSLELIKYKKIILIDVETLFFNDIDLLFNLEPPMSIYTKNNINCGFLLLEPSIKLYTKSIKLIKLYKKKIETNNKPFNFIILKLFNNTSIKKIKFNLGINKYENTDGIQYSIDKPFLMTSIKTIEERIKLNHFKIWFNFLSNIIMKNPELKKYECLKEPIQISKYFLAELSRFRLSYKYKFNKLSQIIKLYGKNKYVNLEYYHLDISKEYSSENIIYPHINYSFQKFINYINKYTIYIDNLNHIINYQNINKIISETKDKILLDFILNNFIKLFTNVFLIIKINEINDNKNINDDNINNELKNNLIYNNNIVLEGFIIKNILFNIYQNYVYRERLVFLSSYNDKKKYNLNIKIFQTIQQIDMLDNNYQNNIFIFAETNTKIRAGSILFNSNTLNRFNSKKISFMKENNKNNLINSINLNSLKKLLLFQTIKKFIYNNWNGEQIENIIIFYKKNLIMLDNNIHENDNKKKIIDNKIIYLDIIFIKSEEYNIFIKMHDFDINYLYEPKYYWELEGIKFYKSNA